MRPIHCPGCGGALSEAEDIYHVLGCGFVGGGDPHEVTHDQNKHEGRHNRWKEGYQTELLARALEQAGGSPESADALFKALVQILEEAGTTSDP